MITNNKNHSTQ